MEPIGILGLSYKPNTNVVEESQAVMLAAELLNAGYKVVAYDPAAMENARGILNGRVMYAQSMEACAAAVRVLVIATPWDEFRSLRPEHLRQSGSRPVVIDWWRILRRDDFEPLAQYVTCGQGPAEAEGHRDIARTVAAADLSLKS